MNLKWDFEKCKKEAEKYTTKFDFRTKSHSAYSAAWRNKWLDKFSWLGMRKYELNKNERDYCVYSYEFPSLNKVYVGLTNNIKRRDRQHRFGIKSSKGIRYSHLYMVANDNNITLPKPIIICANLTSEEAQIKENYYINQYKDKGWGIINIAKTGYNIGSLGSTWIKWDEKSCFEEAKKYSKKSDFKKKSNGAYASSVKNGWYKSYTWFGNNKNNVTHSRGYWNYKTCYEEALKYRSRKEFEKKSDTAAKKAWKNKWMDDYTWFEPPQRKNYWNYETCKKASQECSTRTKFARKYDTAYKMSLKNNWLNEFYGKKN